MSDAWKKLFASSLICYLVAYGVLLLVSVFSYSALTVMPEFQWEWIVARTWTRFLELLPVVQAWAVLLVFAWVVPMQSGAGASTSFDRFGSSIVLLLVLGLGYAAAFLAAHPVTASRLDSLEYTSTLARALVAEAEEARADQNYTRALSRLNQYLVLVGESESVEELLIEVRDEARAEEVRVEVAGSGQRQRLDRSATVEELLDRATAAMTEGDYSTAHYMAILARALEPENADAALVATRALEGLESLAPEDEESAASELFRRKQEARAALTRQEYLEAYFRLAILEQEYPRDLDVRRYLRAAEEQVAELVVFRSDAEAALELPGALDVVVLNRADAGSVELLSMDKLVNTDRGTFAQGVEIYQVDVAGRPIRHVTAEYAELRDGHLLLNVIDRESIAMHLRPTVHVGSVDAVTEGLLALGPTVPELLRLASISRSPSRANLFELSQTLPLLEEHGFLREPSELELFARLVSPVGFLVFSFVMMGFGWRYRSRYLHLPPIPTLLIIPVIPLILIPVYAALEYGQRILLSTIVLTTGTALALTLTVLLQAFLLFASLGYLALGARR